MYSQAKTDEEKERAKEVKEEGHPASHTKAGEENDIPLTGFPFTNNGYMNLAKIADQATRPTWLKHIPPTLPFAVANGHYDPLIQLGHGFKALALQYQHYHFKDVTFYEYDHLGHEILLSEESELVYLDLYRWVLRHL